MKPTPHQRKILRELADGAAIEITPYGCWLSTGARLRPQTATSLVMDQWIKLDGKADGWTARWVITDAGREAINS